MQLVCLIGAVAASPLVTHVSGPRDLVDIPTLDFFTTYTAQTASLHRNDPETLLDRARIAAEGTQMRASMYDYAVVQFNRRYTPLFDKITRELPHKDIFHRNHLTRQRLAANLAQESEKTYLQLLPSQQHQVAHLQQTVQLYRSHLATFAHKSVDWINEAAHKIH